MVHSAVFDEGKTSYVVKSSEHLRDLKEFFNRRKNYFNILGLVPKILLLG